MHLVRQASANSVDPDETPQNAASHQGLYCLPLIQLFFEIIDQLIDCPINCASLIYQSFFSGTTFGIDAKGIIKLLKPSNLDFSTDSTVTETVTVSDTKLSTAYNVPIKMSG